jgi:predicted nucleic acid-binding protein
MAVNEANGALFIDTNILVYANVQTAPLHEQALKAIKAAHQAGRPLWVSRQVLREFVATRTRPQAFAKPSSVQVVIERVRYLEQHFQVADDTAAVTNQLLKKLSNRRQASPRCQYRRYDVHLWHPLPVDPQHQGFWTVRRYGHGRGHWLAGALKNLGHLLPVRQDFR